MTSLAADSPVFEPGPAVTLRTGLGDRTLWWGEPWQWASAAYWISRAARPQLEPQRLRLGASLREEVAACVLGGFGIPASVGVAAFEAVRDARLLDGAVSSDSVEQVLCAPLRVGGRLVRYRFPKQRARRVAAALRFLDCGPIPDAPRDMRDWLVGAPGVGPKTASWVVRNRFACDEVAIIDIHIKRAGEAAGVFDRRWRVERDYPKYEAFFLAWAEHGGVRASILDACIWSELASLGSTDLPTRHP